MNLPGRVMVLVVAGGLSTLLILGALFWRIDSRRAANPKPARTPEQAAAPETPALARTPTDTEEGNQREITLFFQSPEGEDLAPEKRKIFLTGTVTDQARQAVRALIDGSRSGLLPTLPAESQLREIFLGADGTAYVDFSRALVDKHPGGTSAEIDTVFSLVDTLTFNFPEIKRVKILIEGDERETLKEHLDLSRAYTADMSIVNRGEKR